MLNWLYNLLGTLLYWFSSITGGSYALALLLYALVFKILFLPFSIKQQKNQIKMAKLTPKIELIKAKYKGRTDRPTTQKMQQEIMELQQREGYSPFSGCLPLLLQFPIIIFLYNVIRNPLSHILRISSENIQAICDVLGVEGKIDQIALISKIQEAGLDLSLYGAERVLPDFTLFGINLAETPSITKISLLVLIPVLAAGFQWLSMFLMRKWNNTGLVNADDNQTQMSMRMMDIVMPLMTLFIAFGFSGMLGLYWIFQSIIGIIQSFILSKAMPLPRYSEEELKAMRKAQKEQEKAQRQALKEQPKYRSLHYIDEDDYEELPELKKKPKNQNQKKPNSSDAPEIKD
jgi:YidC/Oxa1 family membrane protein insertase